MKNRWIKTAGAVALAMMMFTGMDAQPRQGRGGGPGGPGTGYVQADSDFVPGARAGQQAFLDLTEAQQEEWEALRLKHYKVMKPLRNQMAELKARERTLISEEAVDTKALHKVIDDQTNLMNKIQKLRLEQRLAVREILTDEQLMKLDQRRNNRRMGQGRMGHGQGNRSGGPQCPGGPYHKYHRNRR
ncbi:MAG: Spy/CpxP family protein refolding chaperone [Bacteroidota bacterium]